jgi:hypothetical protein
MSGEQGSLENAAFVPAQFLKRPSLFCEIFGELSITRTEMHQFLGRVFQDATPDIVNFYEMVWKALIIQSEDVHSIVNAVEKMSISNIAGPQLRCVQRDFGFHR